MKLRLISITVAMAVAAVMANCVSLFNPPLTPPGVFGGTGSLFSSYKANFNCWHGEKGSCVGKDGPKAVGSKTGEACASNILGMILTGDMSLEAAAQAGGISKVASVDYSYTNVLGFFAKACTIVNGD